MDKLIEQELENIIFYTYYADENIIKEIKRNLEIPLFLDSINKNNDKKEIKINKLAILEGMLFIENIRQGMYDTEIKELIQNENIIEIIIKKIKNDIEDNVNQVRNEHIIKELGKRIKNNDKLEEVEILQLEQKIKSGIDVEKEYETKLSKEYEKNPQKGIKLADFYSKKNQHLKARLILAKLLNQNKESDYKEEIRKKYDLELELSRKEEINAYIEMNDYENLYEVLNNIKENDEILKIKIYALINMKENENAEKHIKLYNEKYGLDEDIEEWKKYIKK